MSLFESNAQPLDSDMSNMNISEMMDILFNQDMDMGVSRDFYDPQYQEKQQKQREQEQTKIQDLKKRLAQHEAQYFTIDAETGERVPNTAGLLPPPPLTSQTSLGKDLDDLGRMINIDELDIVSYLQDQNPDLSPQQTQTHQMYSQQPVTDRDPWETKVEWFNSDMGYQPYTGQKSDVEGSDPSMDYFEFMESPDSSSSGYEQKYVLGDMDLDNVDMNQVLGEGSNSSFLSYAPSSASTSGSAFHSPAFGGSAGSQTAPSSGSVSSDGSPFSPDSMDEAGSGDGSDSSKARNSNRDEERCEELEVPFTVETIINCPVEEFNSMIRDYRMTDEQLGLVKDIRRRGKNKVAAQNCRKKKQSELSGLESEINDLQRRRNALARDKAQLSASKTELEIQMGHLYQEVFSSLRDVNGLPYDQHYFELDISDDGEVGIVPRYGSHVQPPKYEMNSSAAYTLLDLSMKG